MGITLSENQVRLPREQVERVGVQHLVQIRLQELPRCGGQVRPDHGLPVPPTWTIGGREKTSTSKYEKRNSPICTAREWRPELPGTVTRALTAKLGRAPTDQEAKMLLAKAMMSKKVAYEDMVAMP